MSALKLTHWKCLQLPIGCQTPGSCAVTSLGSFFVSAQALLIISFYFLFPVQFSWHSEWSPGVSAPPPLTRDCPRKPQEGWRKLLTSDTVRHWTLTQWKRWPWTISKHCLIRSKAHCTTQLSYVTVDGLYSLSGSLFLHPLVLQRGFVRPSYRCNPVVAHKLYLPSIHPTA